MRIGRNGFTIAEIMVVIVILAIGAFISSNVNFSQKIDSENRDRLINEILATLSQTHADAMMGRGVLVNGVIINPLTTNVAISTGTLSVTYMSGTSILAHGTQVSYPFYGDTYYSIPDVTLVKADGTTTTADPNLVIGYQGTNIYFTGGTNDPTSVIVRIHAEYKTSDSYVTLDRRTGKIQIDPGINPLPN